MCLVPELVEFSLVNILARAFYAVEDVKTPAKGERYFVSG